MQLPVWTRSYAFPRTGPTRKQEASPDPGEAPERWTSQRKKKPSSPKSRTAGPGWATDRPRMLRLAWLLVGWRRAEVVGVPLLWGLTRQRALDVRTGVSA